MANFIPISSLVSSVWAKCSRRTLQSDDLREIDLKEGVPLAASFSFSAVDGPLVLVCRFIDVMWPSIFVRAAIPVTGDTDLGAAKSSLRSCRDAFSGAAPALPALMGPR